MNKADFMRGRIEVPWPLCGDAYTVAGECLASPDARYKSVYNFTNRYSPKKAFPEVAKDSRMVFYGLTEFIRHHLIRKVTHEQIDQAVEFMSTAHSLGGPLAFDPIPWRRVVNKYDGYLPLRIQALPEGSTWFPNEPIIQVTSLGEGFGEIAAMVEAIMVGMVSIASAKVTLYRHWLERIREWCKIDQNEAMAQFMVHDFGMRASSCAEESELLGKAQLLVFHGTDTFNAAYQARVMGAKPPTGTSILALAHRIVQGFECEQDAYANLQAQDKIGSYVADCYDFKKAIENYLIPLAKTNKDSTIVSRPDSGDYVANDNFVRTQALEAGLVESRNDESSPYVMYSPINFTTINGDSMNPRKQEILFRERLKNNFCPTRWGIFGVGGYGRNTPTRDVLSSAYKLCAKGKELTPVIKLSDSPGKMSVPGPTNIRRYPDCDSRLRQTVFLESEYHCWGTDAYVDYYNADLDGDSKFGDIVLTPFNEIQKRTIEDFDRYNKFSEFYPEYGTPKNSCLSDNILELQKATLEKYK